MAQNIGESFVKNSIIKSEDAEVYIYGFELMISECISSIAVIIIGILMGNVIESILYLVTFTCIRVYAGGYHASSYKNCITLFCTCAYLVLSLIRWMDKVEVLSLLVIALFIADIIIFILAPVEDYHKKLKRCEQQKYKKIIRKEVIIFSSIFLFIFLVFPTLRYEISYCIAAICEVSIFLVIGYVKNML